MWSIMARKMYDTVNLVWEKMTHFYFLLYFKCNCCVSLHYMLWNMTPGFVFTCSVNNHFSNLNHNFFFFNTILKWNMSLLCVILAYSDQFRHYFGTKTLEFEGKLKPSLKAVNQCYWIWGCIYSDYVIEVLYISWISGAKIQSTWDWDFYSVRINHVLHTYTVFIYCSTEIIQVCNTFTSPWFDL